MINKILPIIFRFELGRICRIFNLMVLWNLVTNSFVSKKPMAEQRSLWTRTKKGQKSVNSWLQILTVMASLKVLFKCKWCFNTKQKDPFYLLIEAIDLSLHLFDIISEFFLYLVFFHRKIGHNCHLEVITVSQWLLWAFSYKLKLICDFKSSMVSHFENYINIIGNTFST